MALNKKYTVLWIVWILAFIGIETAAIKNKMLGDTLSEHVRDWIGTKSTKRTIGMWMARGGVLGLLIWLIPHFMTGGW